LLTHCMHKMLIRTAGAAARQHELFLKIKIIAMKKITIFG